MLVLVRTVNAGVHFGYLKERTDQEIYLTDARRIWSWEGANTLSEIALRGCGAGSRISEKIPWIILLEVIEIMPISAEAAKVLETVKWTK